MCGSQIGEISSGTGGCSLQKAKVHPCGVGEKRLIVHFGASVNDPSKSIDLNGWKTNLSLGQMEQLTAEWMCCRKCTTLTAGTFSTADPSKRKKKEIYLSCI
ncbi:hypothetical protein AVEN_144182-1 [Araneus ventricosus]|uniref:Uncharacterized protein n=1 Tax=Araneus ventricosus TaxID=182803 RepID=A0A4Y2KVB3_ARAVE|nr:hypothetical protein AVEN_144182-1 [Araneus ventricosus]